MGPRRSAAPLIVVMLWMGLACTAHAQVISPTPETSEAETFVGPPRPPAAPVLRTRRTLLPRKATYISRWVGSLSWWQEGVALTRASTTTNSDVRSSLLAFGFGRQWRWQFAKWGWAAEVQALLGQNESESRDPGVVYFHNQDPSYGVMISVGGIYLVERPAVLFTSSLAAMYRQVNYSAPAGFSFGDNAGRLLPYLRFEMAIPITARLDLVENIAFPLSGVQGDGLWWTTGLHF